MILQCEKIFQHIIYSNTEDVTPSKHVQKCNNICSCLRNKNIVFVLSYIKYDTN